MYREPFCVCCTAVKLEAELVVVHKVRGRGKRLQKKREKDCLQKYVPYKYSCTRNTHIIQNKESELGVSVDSWGWPVQVTWPEFCSQRDLLDICFVKVRKGHRCIMSTLKSHKQIRTFLLLLFIQTHWDLFCIGGRPGWFHSLITHC